MANLTASSTVKLPSGHGLPVLGYGVYKAPKEITTDVTTEALRLGYRHIDSATMYWNQGPAAAAIAASGVPRSDVFFTTKIFARDGTLDYDKATAQIQDALAETQLSYLDLVLIHAPHGGPENRRGAWRALVDFVAQGKIRSIGVSNYGVHHLDELEAYIAELEAERGKGNGGVISVGQWELHPWLMRRDIVEWCKKRGVAVEAYCPIVRGERFDDPKLQALVKKYGKTPAQILLRWSLQQGLVPLVKSVTPSRIKENVDVFDFALDREDVQGLETAEYSPCAWDPTVKPLEE